MKRISCFTILRDTLSQGYPFVESIISAMPLCDEFVISDGYSNDGTYEILKELAELYPQIKLYRDKWMLNNKNTKENGILAEMTNIARGRCSSDYLFYIQANEVVHEKSIRQLRELPSHSRSGVEMYHLPYLLIMGKDLNFSEEFRSRLVANKKEIGAINDATHLVYHRKTIKGYLMHAVMNPLSFMDKLDALMNPYQPGVDGINRPYIHVNMVAPMFRYYGIYKKNYLKKLAGHMQTGSAANELYSELTSKLNGSSEGDFPMTYYKVMMKYSKGSYFEVPQILPAREHPKLMIGLFKRCTERYAVREELLERPYYR